MPPLVTDLAQIAARTAQQQADNDAFAHYVDIMWKREGRDDAELDALVARLAAAVSAQIDCLACANCCRSLTVGLEPDDILRLAAGLHLPPDAVIARYADRATGAQDGEWAIFRRVPCALLRGSRCLVYAHRPQSCRVYPALTPDFRYLMPDLLRGAGQCPIIFNVIERLKRALDW